jgi:formamidase
MEINILKNGVELLGNGTMPIYLPSPVDPMYSDKIVFQGLGVDMHGDGRQVRPHAPRRSWH